MSRRADLGKAVAMRQRIESNLTYELHPDYQDVVRSFVDHTLVDATENDYHGDSLMVVVRDGRYGYLQFGWGSCSGCDALVACDTRAEVVDLAIELNERVTWYDSLDDLRGWVERHDWEGDYVDSALVTEFRSKVAALTDD